jgi:hypothetical protein
MKFQPNRTITNIHSAGHQQSAKPSAGHTTPTPKERDAGRFADPHAAMQRDKKDNGR